MAVVLKLSGDMFKKAILVLGVAVPLPIYAKKAENSSIGKRISKATTFEA